MNTFRRISSVILIIITLFLLSGCAERPFLTKDANYTIVTISSDETEHRIPIQLPWNSNFAVIQKLLLEASLVLGDLHSFPLTSLESTTTDSLESPIELKNEPEAEKVLIKETILAKAILDETIINETDLDLTTLDEAILDETILLEATFPEKKPFELFIDNETQTIDISSVQIEVIGNHPGRVILNGEMILLGIPNPNLESAFEEFLEMQHKTSEIPKEVTEKVTEEN